MSAFQRHWALFSNRNFMLLWGGQTASRIGDGFSRMVIIWTVYDTTNSPLMLGLVLLMQAISPAITGLVSGIVVDRSPRKRVLMAADIANFITVGGLSWLSATNNLAIWHFMVAAFAISFASSFFRIARQAALPDILTEKNDLMTANAVLSGTFQVAFLISPAVAGFLLARLGTTPLLLIDLGTYGLSLLTLIPLRIAQVHTTPPKADQRRNPLYDISVAWQFVRQDRTLLLVISTFGLGTMLAGGAARVGMPILAERIGAGSTGYGLFDSAVGIGTLVGSIILGSILISNKGRMVFLGWIVEGVVLILLSFSGTLAWPLAILLVSGLSNAAINVSTESLLQERTVAGMRGRVFGLWMMAIWVGESIGYFVFGFLVLQLSLAIGYLVAGVALILISLYVVRLVWVEPPVLPIAKVTGRVV